MIKLPGNIKICGINDYFLMNQAFVDSMFQEHIKYFIFKSLQNCTTFLNNSNPIRVASSMSMIKRLVTPGSQVFKSTYPFGVMAVEETDDEELGALIAPQNKAMRNMFFPQEVSTMPIVKRMKSIDIKNNLDIRVSYESTVYNVGFVYYDESRQKTYNVKKKWDYKIEPGRFYTEKINMTTIIPKEFIYKFCIYKGVDYNLNWFVEFMNNNANTLTKFKVGLDPGTKHYEVFMYYPVEAMWRATTTTPPEIEEEGDTDRHWTISRSFLVSVNTPMSLYFGRERDVDLPDYDPSISYPFENIETKISTTTTVPDNIASITKEVQMTVVDDYEGYSHIASYDFSKDDLDNLRSNDYTSFDVAIFDNILPVDYEESIFYYYSINQKIIDRATNPPIKIVFKLGNTIVDIPLKSIENGYVFNINIVKEILAQEKFTIFIYFHTYTYRVFTTTKGLREMTLDTMNISIP